MSTGPALGTLVRFVIPDDDRSLDNWSKTWLRRSDEERLCIVIREARSEDDWTWVWDTVEDDYFCVYPRRLVEVERDEVAK